MGIFLLQEVTHENEKATLPDQIAMYRVPVSMPLRYTPGVANLESGIFPH